MHWQSKSSYFLRSHLLLAFIMTDLIISTSLRAISAALPVRVTIIMSPIQLQVLLRLRGPAAPLTRGEPPPPPSGPDSPQSRPPAGPKPSLRASESQPALTGHTDSSRLRLSRLSLAVRPRLPPAAMRAQGSLPAGIGLTATRDSSLPLHPLPSPPAPQPLTEAALPPGPGPAGCRAEGRVGVPPGLPRRRLIPASESRFIPTSESRLISYPSPRDACINPP